jgi:hypothetical protein
MIASESANAPRRRATRPLGFGALRPPSVAKSAEKAIKEQFPTLVPGP